MVRIGGIVVVLAVVQVLLAWLLLDVFHANQPHEVPVALIGSGPPVAGMVAALEQDGTFEVTRAKSGQAARKLIGEREVYGAYAPLAGAGRVLVAGAASPDVADLLRTTARGIDAKRDVKTIPSDIRPLPAADRAGLSGFVLTIVAALIGVLAGWGLEAAAPSVRRGWKKTLLRIGVLALLSLGTGALLALVATQLDLYEGHFPEVGGALALATFGAATVSAFLTSLTGVIVGGVLGLGVFVAVSAVATSGGASAPELLPELWTTIGSGLPGQSSVELIRNLVYFNNEAIEMPLAILGAYALGGALLMVVLSPFRRLPS